MTHPVLVRSPVLARSDGDPAFVGRDVVSPDIGVQVPVFSPQSKENSGPVARNKLCEAWIRLDHQDKLAVLTFLATSTRENPEFSVTWPPGKIRSGWIDRPRAVAIIDKLNRDMSKLADHERTFLEFLSGGGAGTPDGHFVKRAQLPPHRQSTL